ncbi:TonB-dependent receptor [candidate division WOR-3 bacterium]|uniref:TonB-dependent receptor n=1 Tax=candidate division WOR-3 bacterium TaxID=2052148 RepID=A0A9D5QDF2_UNCW3|nr:TonB-dependent receptor [candidate division WOR-3 bacterium]MBD3364991.1 TonB-dependent receptor [candidate division WOR-3 bacterium]
MPRLLLVLSLVLPLSVSAGTGVITGRVKDNDSRKPIQGAKVALYIDTVPLIEVFTNKRGRYKIEDFPCGDYEIEFSKANYETERIEVSVRQGEKTRVNVLLSVSGLSDIILPAIFLGVLDYNTSGRFFTLPSARGTVPMHTGVFWEDMPVIPSYPLGHYAPLLQTENTGLKIQTSTFNENLWFAGPTNSSVDIDCPDVRFSYSETLFNVLGTASYESQGNSFRTKMAARLADKNQYTTTKNLAVFGSYKRSGNIRDANSEIPNSDYNGFSLGGNAWLYSRRYSMLGVGLRYQFYQADLGVPADTLTRYSALEDQQRHLLLVSGSIPLVIGRYTYRSRSSKYSGYEVYTPNSIQVVVGYQHYSGAFHTARPYIEDTRFELDSKNSTRNSGYFASVYSALQTGDNNYLKFGASGLHANVSSRRQYFLTEDSLSRELSLDRVLPDAVKTDIGAFTEYASFFDNRSSLRGGLRYDLSSSGYSATPSYPGDTSSSMDGGLSAYIDYELPILWWLDLHTELSTIFRAPTVLERYTRGEGPGTFDMGNPGLEPEQSFNGNLGLGAHDESHNYSASVSGFGKLVHNYICKQPTSGFERGLPVETWVNIERARFMGGGISVSLRPAPGVSIYSSSSYVHAEDMTSGEPFASVPPLNGYVTADYYDGFVSAGIQMNWAAGQERVAASETKTPGYVTFDADAGLNLGKFFDYKYYLNLQISVNNILNVDYRSHLSLVKDYYGQPGRTFEVSLWGDF